jgi:TorA maturation chaperone TorD
MRDRQVAQARSNAYSLFGRLFLDGLTSDLRPYIQAVPDLAAVAPRSSDAAAGSGPDGDRAAAEHYSLLGFNVFPFQSIFLDPQALLGGSVTDSVLAFYREAGFQGTPFAENADHLGVELALLAFLSGAEADAWRDGLPKTALRMRHLQRRFLDEHLMRWLTPLVRAIRQQAQPFYSALAGLTLELALAHRSALGPGETHEPASFLPPLPDLLDDDKTGLKEIAGYLLTPAYSGLYLSRDDVARLARRHGLPRGFGTRRQTLVNLLHAAADYAALDPLLADLRGLVDDWRAFYATFLDGTPALAAIAGTWIERISVTQELLEDLTSAVQADQTALRAPAPQA